MLVGCTVMPVNAGGAAETVTVTPAVKAAVVKPVPEPVAVTVMVAVPGATAVTTPVVGLTSAIEELCRFVSPVTHMRRTAASDIDLYGTRIPKGAKVVLWFASANRDERQFADPDRLHIDRGPNAHVGFGMGAHFCVGAHLARLETRLFLDAFLDRIETMELLAEPERLPSNWFTGWTSMKVRWS